VPRDTAENSLPRQLFTHFGLRENPFGVTPDIRFLYQSRTHREALTSLINGIDFGFGFQVLIGQPGMGKTSLLFSLLETFRTDAHTAFVFQPQNEPHDLLQSVLYELGTSSAETSLHKLFEQVNDVLYRAARERKRVILVVDEAQNLEYVVLEALRQLSNFETPDAKLLQVVLAGQPQLAEKLAAGAHEQLRQRISAISRLRPLALDETEAYIKHRLATAEYSGADLFTEGGVRRIWSHSKGVPRNINTLCFGAMMLGFAERAKSIDERFLEEAARALDLNGALADVFAMEPAFTAGRGNGKVQPTKNATGTETDDGSAVANEEPVANAGSIPHEAGDEAGTMTASARVDRNTAGASDYVPPSVAEALVRITQALEEQRLLLMAKSGETSEPLAVPPVIPLYYSAEEAAKTPAALESTLEAPSAGVEGSTVDAIPDDRAAKLETNSTLKTAEGEVRAEPNSAADIAAQQEGNAGVKQSLTSDPVPDPAAMVRSASVAKKLPPRRMAWTKALSFAAFTGILALMLFEKFPLRLGTVKAGLPGRSTVARDSQPTGFSVPSRVPASLTVGPSARGTNPAADSHPPRPHSSHQSQEVVVRRFSTDLDVTSKNSSDGPELRRIFFNEDSDLIDSQYRPWLQQLADALAQDPAATVTLEGHTDASGGEAHNLNLSNHRALAVRNALVNDLHVAKARLTAKGLGSRTPLQPNSSAAGRAYNRRVEVRLTHSTN
jgi:type II secretory pathway predicted ATPase ExeA/outer membrane protein OmpA-like peptidoglycan-associated protein